MEVPGVDIEFIVVRGTMGPLREAKKFGTKGQGG
jgi:hypothetical protein